MPASVLARSRIEPGVAIPSRGSDRLRNIPITREFYDERRDVNRGGCPGLKGLPGRVAATRPRSISTLSSQLIQRRNDPPDPNQPRADPNNALIGGKDRNDFQMMHERPSSREPEQQGVEGLKPFGALFPLRRTNGTTTRNTPSIISNCDELCDDNKRNCTLVVADVLVDVD